jgi:hypothetical protein
MRISFLQQFEQGERSGNFAQAFLPGGHFGLLYQGAIYDAETSALLSSASAAKRLGKGAKEEAVSQ